jgi:hypothetical protein
MCKLYVRLPNRSNIFPFESEMGALYFASALTERANRNDEYLPAIDIVSDETGEVLYQSPEVTPCERIPLDAFKREIDKGGNPCASCPKKRGCALFDQLLPW